MAKKAEQPTNDKLAVFEAALKEISKGNAMDKYDLAIQIAEKALKEAE
jgi:hypothetical protein